MMVWVTTNLDTNLVIPADSHILIGQLQGRLAVLTVYGLSGCKLMSFLLLTLQYLCFSIAGDIAGHHRSMFPEHGTVSCVRLIMSVTTAGELMQDFAAAAHFKLSGETVLDFCSKFLNSTSSDQMTL